MKNGRCRMHGGKSTGPKSLGKLLGNQNAKGNKSRLTTGEYELITADSLTVEEIELIRLEPANKYMGDLLFEEIRLRRMMQKEDEILGSKKTNQGDLEKLRKAQISVIIKNGNLLLKQVNKLPIIKEHNLKFGNKNRIF